MIIAKAKSSLPFLFLSSGLCFIPSVAQASEDPIQDFYDQTTINGDIRAYYFDRDYSNETLFDQYAYSLGGNLRILSGEFLDGFKVGAAVYTAQSLDLNNDNIKKVDQSLPGRDVTTLGQAYLQYQHADVMIRGGDQLLNTPWMNAADSRMIPATYRGFYGTYTLTSAWTLSALRIFGFKSRISDDFSRTNLYNPNNQGTPIAGLGSASDDGAQALGVNYKTDKLTGQVWGYQFFDFAKLLYADAQYSFKNASGITPLLGTQLVLEGGDGDNELQQVSTGKADAFGYGVITGIETERTRLTLAYNKLFADNDAYNNGDIVSPYTSGYASDPLYTTSMMQGLVEKSAGDALKLSGTYFVFEKQLQLTASYAQYYTQPYVHDTNETDFDVTYAFNKHSKLKGLSIRNRLGILNGGSNTATSYYERVMLQYSF